VKAYSLDNLKPFSYLLVVIERFINLLAFPAGFILRALFSKFLWQTIVFLFLENNYKEMGDEARGKKFKTFVGAWK